MSEEENEGGTSCCASCGIAEIDDIKLMPCDGCDLVKYCGDDCKNNHKSQHEEACKQRAAELRDELLFKQPESTHMGDCPICCLPLSLDVNKSIMYTCCSKLICNGCNMANRKREFEAVGLQFTCPFCREPAFITEEEADKLRMKRIEANDPVAMVQEGMKQYESGDFNRAFEHFTKAVALGDTAAHYRLAWLYQNGKGVEKDELKYIHHAEEAAIGGHPRARYNLGAHECSNNDDLERAMKHWIISAKQGDDLSIKALIKAFKHGFIEKDDLAAAFRAHKAAVDATKSPQRKAADEVKKFMDLTSRLS